MPGSVDRGPDGLLRIGWAPGEPDWLGPGTVLDGRRGAAAPHPGIEVAVEPLDPTGAGTDGETEGDASPVAWLVSLAATEDLTGLAGAGFTDVGAGVRFAPGERPHGSWPEGLQALGFQLTEFGLPVRADADLARWRPLLPHRPASVLPLLLLAPDGRTILLAPVAGAHEQALAVDAAGALTWGWHGDLDRVPAGYRSTLAVVAGRSARRCLERWGALVLGSGGPPARPADALGTRVSYWTDNGAAYWYRTEPGHDVVGSIAATVADLRDRGIAVGAVQVDSWWYPHEVLRPFDTDEWVVPPTGLLSWTPRPDVLPGGLAPLRAAVGEGTPLVAHIRHLSARSPLVAEHGCSVDPGGDQAHPSPSLYARWLDDAVASGIATFEHDWLVECFLGVRQVREEAGRARAWQRGIDAAAAERDLTLQWCMATPADMVEAAHLARVTSVRTSGDHGYLVGPGFLWGWFLLVNALARVLGLAPFKDVFHAGSEHGELEGLLSVLSAGPVGLGDRLGVADVAVTRRTCRADGVLVQPDVPLAALDPSFRAWPGGRARLLLADCETVHEAGRWRYVLAVNPDDEGGDGVLDAAVDLATAGGAVVWDGRTGAVLDAAPTSVALRPHDWAYWVVTPGLCGGRLAVLGDPGAWATAGRARVASVAASPGGDAVRVELAGAPGEAVVLRWWRAAAGVADEAVTLDGAGRAALVLTP